ncbi:RHS repeat-associated core domain-containing protein, partial [Paracidovorax oryzae]|uniref:RHS repeat-associated core domain-containing protein n=1 Tax=Paracidovorax oryzae TaxID=862720 RepID=UPI0035CEC6E1
RGSKVVSYVYEPGSYVPLARIDADGLRLEGSGHGGLVAGAGPDAAGRATSANPGTGYAALNPIAAPGSSAAAHAASDPAYRPAHAPPPAESRLRASAQVSYFHNDPSGLPEEVTDEAGEVRWRASWRTWGSALEERWEAVRIDGSAIPAVQQRHRDEESLEQNLRLQGQYLDRETGLHYNTFRYYDPDVGRFISPDPIGLAGGLNLQRYAANPLAWIDPWGLCGEKIKNKFPNEGPPADGKILGTAVSNNGLVTIPGKGPLRGTFDFVVTQDNQLILGKRHVTLSGGADVQAAGSMRLKNGKILEIDNLSGHYQPTPAQAAGFPSAINNAGFSTNGATLQPYSISPTPSGNHVLPPRPLPPTKL